MGRSRPTLGDLNVTADRPMARHERLSTVSTMISDHFNGQATATGDLHRALLGVSEVIVSHRDPTSLFQEIAGRLHQVVQFDALSLVLHDATTNTMRLHVLETSEPIPDPLVIVLSVEDDPAGLVWQTQQPLITSTVTELRAGRGSWNECSRLESRASAGFR